MGEIMRAIGKASPLTDQLYLSVSMSLMSLIYQSTIKQWISYLSTLISHRETDL